MSGPTSIGADTHRAIVTKLRTENAALREQASERENELLGLLYACRRARDEAEAREKTLREALERITDERMVRTVPRLRVIARAALDATKEE